MKQLARPSRGPVAPKCMVNNGLGDCNIYRERDAQCT